MFPSDEYGRPTVANIRLEVQKRLAELRSSEFVSIPLHPRTTKPKPPDPTPEIAPPEPKKYRIASYVILVVVLLEIGAAMYFYRVRPGASVPAPTTVSVKPPPAASATPNPNLIDNSEDGCAWVRNFNSEHGKSLVPRGIDKAGVASECR